VIGKFLLTAVFVVLIGWDIWEAVGNALGLPAFYLALGLQETTPWALLILGVLIPLAALAAGLWWGLRRPSLPDTGVIYALALATQGALALSLLAGEQAWRAYSIQGLLG